MIIFSNRVLLLHALFSVVSQAVHLSICHLNNHDPRLVALFHHHLHLLLRNTRCTGGFICPTAKPVPQFSEVVRLVYSRRSTLKEKFFLYKSIAQHFQKLAQHLQKHCTTSSRVLHESDSVSGCKETKINSVK